MDPSKIKTMNTLNRLVSKFGSFGRKLLLPLVACGMSLPAFGQLQWNSYDAGGNLIAAKVATGGDVASATSVNFIIPASSTNFFVTKNFTPINLSQANASVVVTFKFSASAGLTGVAQRTVAWGLYNSAGTTTLADDIGMFGGWYGPGAYVEGLFHASGTAYLFSGTSPGLGQTGSGTPSNGTIYTNQIRLYLKTAPVGVALGSSSSTLGAAGVAMNGSDLTRRGFTNPSNGTNIFDEFAFMFYNTTANPVTVTLSGIGLGNSLTWDASGVSPTVPTDGGGNWSSTNANWSSGVGGAIGASDSIWSPGYNAIFGAGGASGTVTNTDATTVVGNITFNTNYVVVGNPLVLTNGSVITVAGSNTVATLGPVLGGTGGFTKEGAGTLVLNSSVNNTYTGDTIINNGTLQPGGTAGRSYVAGNLIINPNGTFVANSGVPGQGVFGSATVVINGGIVTNTSSGSFTAPLCVLANNGTILNAGGAVSSTYFVTNTDARNGSIFLTRHGFGITNVLYKSTAGTVTIGTRPNSSANDGYLVTLNAGALVFDKGYANNAAGRLKQNVTLTFAGGMLVFSNNLTALAPSTENPGAGGTVFNPGASSFYSINAGASGGSMTMGAITRKTGATFNFVAQSGPGSIGSTTANVNGIVGGWNTYNLTDWTTGTSTWAALAAGGYVTSANPTTWLAANNVSLSASTLPNVPNATAINTLRLTGASTVTLDGSLTLSSGGLLVTGSGTTAITGGTLLGASGADLIIHQNASADLTISSTLADNGGATSLTKDGAGKVILTGANNMTGANYLNGGVVEVSDLAKLASGSLDMNGGTLRYTGADTGSARAVTTRGLGPTFDIVSGTTVTQTGAVNGSGDVIGDLGGITKTGAGTLVLTASNNFNGETVVNGGALVINGTNACNPSVWDAGRVTVNGGTLGGSGLISGPVTVNNGGTIAPGASIGTLTLATSLTLGSGSTSLFEVTNGAAGDLLVVNGNLNIAANSTIAVKILGTALEPATNTLITYTGTKTGSFNPTVTVVGGSLDASLTIDESTPGQIKLVAVPQVAITGQPQDDIASTNDSVTLTVTATGLAPLHYQWYFYGDNTNNAPVELNDATDASYNIASAQGTDNGYYNVVVSNSYNAVSSRFALLIVGNVAPVINGPLDQTVIQGHDATFSASLSIANPEPTYQWQTNGVDVAGATGLSLTLHNVQYDLNGATVSLVASNAAAIVTNHATLTVIIPPAINPQPANLTVNAGDAVVFITTVSGVPTPDLQWFKNGTAIPGEKTSTLSINNARGSDIATYSLVASNAAGVATSSGEQLTVISTTLAQTIVSPANNASAICYDTPLYVTFNGPVSIVNSGKIRIYNVTNSVTPVDTIDMSSNTVVVSGGINLTNNIQPHSLFSGDTQVINYFPVIISGSTAAIYPHGGVMTSNQTYYVTMDNGIVADSTGAYFTGISDTNAWRFTTKATGPADPANLVVAADGSGDFVTVQGAVDSILPGNTTYTRINIHDGIYTELVNISGKNNITFHGQSRAGTVVGYPNNNNLTGTTAGRMSFKVNSSDITLDNLTLTNGTPQGGSQAETLLIYNNGLRCVVENCDIVSRQDTILINANTSQGYFYNCKVIGNFDYVWGVGVGYFDSCVFHTIVNSQSSSYNLTAARTATSGTLSSTTPWVNPNGTTYSAYGFSFVNCTIEADAGVSNITMAGSNGTAGGLDSWVNCLIDTNAYVTPTTTLSNTYVFWQNNNKDITGANPISFANIQTIGVTNNDPRLLAATNVTTWFSGWVPQLAPNTAPVFTAPPAGTNIIINARVNLSVACLAVDSDLPAQTLTYSLLPGFPSGAAVNPVSGNLTWRPTIAQANSANPISVVVTDNGTPNLTATNSFTVTVNPIIQPATSSATYANGQFSFTVDGQTGPDYIVQASTNMVDWQSLITNSSPTLPFVYVYTNNANLPVQFYRVLLGP